jgi:hypothetical protein
MKILIVILMACNNSNNINNANNNVGNINNSNNIINNGVLIIIMANEKRYMNSWVMVIMKIVIMWNIQCV